MPEIIRMRNGAVQRAIFAALLTHPDSSMKATDVLMADLERIYDLWVEHHTKLPDEDRRRLSLKPVHLLAVE